MGDDNVFLFPKIKDGADAIPPPASRKKVDYGACRHKRRVVLDKEAHQMTCADCAQVLDCFDWIHDYVGRWVSVRPDPRHAVLHDNAPVDLLEAG